MAARMWIVVSVCIALLLGVSSASAQVRNAREFRYDATIQNAITTFRFARWEPNDAWSTQDGFYLMFFGGTDPASGCSNVIDGPVTTSTFWTNFQTDTGVALGAAGTAFSPISTASNCTYSNWLGFSHAHYRNVSDASGAAGIGLYSHTGPKPTDGSLAFFQPYPPAGDRHQSNGSIQGTFAIFTCGNSCGNPNSTIVTKPFSGASSDYNLLRAAIISKQGLVKLTGENLGRQQLKQETAVSFMTLSGNFREVQLLPMNAITGINVPTSLTDMMVAADPSQGGAVFVTGLIGSVGQTSSAKDGVGNTYPVWTSWAEPTQRTTWTGQKKFQVEVSFNQLLNVVRLATAKYVGAADARTVTETQMRTYFGANYANPTNWVISATSVGQEVFNPDWGTKRAYMGGSTTLLRVLSLPCGSYSPC